MPSSDGVWILGIHMTKFGKHPDRDIVDLGAEAVLGALGDAGVRMRDMGVMAMGDLRNCRRARDGEQAAAAHVWMIPVPARIAHHGKWPGYAAVHDIA